MTNLFPYLACNLGSVLEKKDAQYGHWKSEYKMSCIGADTSPIVWSLLDMGRAINDHSVLVFA